MAEFTQHHITHEPQAPDWLWALLLTLILFCTGLILWNA